MNLKHLTDATLLSDTQNLVRQERELLTTILHHLREIERRRLFGQYSSLFAYAVGALNYSEDQAFRRIQAMRLLREMPQIEDRIESGEINLTHVGLAHSLFKNEQRTGSPLSSADKLKVFDALAGQTTREAQRVVQSFATVTPPRPETVKPLGPGRNLMTIEVSDELLAKIEKLKDLLAHKDPDLSIHALFERTCDLALDQWNPARLPQRKTRATSKAAVRRAVWARDQNACVRCTPDYAVEQDHITPASMGEADTLENLRLLCRSCNQRAAIEKLGLDKMDPHFSPAAPRVSPQFAGPSAGCRRGPGGLVPAG